MDNEIPPLELRKLVSFADLKAIGWPYCRVQTKRMISAGRFPRCLKLGPGNHGHIVWYLDEVVTYLEAQRWEPDDPDDTSDSPTP